MTSPSPSAKAPLLEGRGLVKRFPRPAGRDTSRPRASRSFTALHAVDLTIGPGEALGLVGESGCGKSTLARLLGLLHDANEGEVLFRGAPIRRRGGWRPRSNTTEALAEFRKSVQTVFQDPFSSLNPRLSVFSAMSEPLVVNATWGRRPSRSDREARIVELLELVGLTSDLLHRFPHELSGGQRQRIAIGRALALSPELVIADEPLSALDVSVQSQVLNLLDDLRRTRGLAYLFISHDLTTVEHLCDRIAVMYLGRIVETAPREQLFHAPAHPYTRALIDAVPQLATGPRTPTTSGLDSDVPSAFAPPPGCPFHPRCPRSDARCRTETPELLEHAHPADSRQVACFYPLVETQGGTSCST